MAELRIAELRRIGAGREAEVYALDGDRVLRLARTPALRAEVESERRALLAAECCGAPVPRCFERLDADGRPGLVLERLDAHDLLSGMVRRPWEVLALPSVLARLHTSLHETVAPAGLPDLHAAVAERLGSELVPTDVRDAAQRALQRLPPGDRLCHGDFHPGNVLRRRDGRFAVVDWKAAARGHPDADVARTRLLIVGAWIPGTPRPLQLGLSPFRRLLYAAYLSAYRRKRPAQLADVSAWVPVLAAARLAYDIPQERVWLLGLARRGLRVRSARRGRSRGVGAPARRP